MTDRSAVPAPGSRIPFVDADTPEAAICLRLAQGLLDRGELTLPAPPQHVCFIAVVQRVGEEAVAWGFTSMERVATAAQVSGLSADEVAAALLETQGMLVLVRLRTAGLRDVACLLRFHRESGTA